MAMIKLGEDGENSEQLLIDNVNGIDFDNNDLEIEGDELELEGGNIAHGLVTEGTGLDIEENNIENEVNGFENDCEQMLEIEDRGLENSSENVTASQGNIYPPPVGGMEFDSYDDAYNYYNLYGKDLGFAIRVKSSWTKRNSKEKRGAVLCCNCEGFKTLKEANSRRKETRTGCLAMIRLRLVESNRWRVDEVQLDHNHSFDPDRAQNSKSNKKDSGTKRKLEPTPDVEVRTIKLYRTVTPDPLVCGSSNSNEGEGIIRTDVSKRLKLKQRDVQALHSYFSRVQLTDPGFFYLMDLNDEGFLRNAFWIGSRSRASYAYFGDVVILDTSCLSRKYDIPLFSFVGINQHGQYILLGCGLLVDESFETYIWLLRTWLTCMLGRPPQTVITEHHCQAMQTAISEVFPRVHYRLSLPSVMQSILESFATLENYATFETIMNATVYDFLRVDEFEIAWHNTMQQFGLADNHWLRTLFEDRERWAPIYSKDTFFAGISVSQRAGESSLVPFFEGYIHQRTSLQEFLDIYESALQKTHQKEALEDSESKNSTLPLQTKSYYELQLSKLYTNNIFKKFQDEVTLMYSCFMMSQVNAGGPAVTMYTLKEHENGENDENLTDTRTFEVMYDKAGGEVRCSCSCFNFKGYLCRHALYILNHTGVEEIPVQYVLARWRKDFKRIYVPEIGANNVDVTNPVQWFYHLYRRAMQVVEEGMVSVDHYKVASEAFKESLNKVHLARDKRV